VCGSNARNAHSLQGMKEGVRLKISCTLFQVDIAVWLLIFFRHAEEQRFVR